MKFLDLFAGIGGFREGMMRAGHTSVGWCEIDRYAQKAYRLVHEPEGEWFCDDVRAVNPADLPDFDCICGGFPCQAFSIAGKRGGFADTRGTLFFEIMRIARARKPKYLFLENVKGLLSHDRGRTFATILNALAESGYDCQWQTLNSKDFGVPQNRERVFIVANLRGQPRPKVFPITGENQNTLKIAGRLDIKGMDCIKRVYSPEGLSPALTTMQGGNREPKILDDQGRRNKKHKLHDICPTLRAQPHGNEPKVIARAFATPDRLHKNQNGRRFKEPDEPAFTLTAQDIHGVAVKRVHSAVNEALRLAQSKRNEKVAVKLLPNGDIRLHKLDRRKSGLSELQVNYEGNVANTVTASHEPKIYGDSTDWRIRKLTPLECFRLQGFPDEWYYKLRDHLSDTKLYKLAGNAVTVNVVEAIARRLPS